ncbi:MAG: hypothetical protein JKY67_02675 [Pseudomonadales bacterium]|nr:hypothetical protein [Pseudomonadales bacterium]
MRIVAVFVLIALSFPAAASTREQINGAFGISLGQLFDKSSAIGQRTMHDGTRALRFQPDKTFEFFSRYYVLVTKEPHAVYAIWAEGDMEDDEKCREAQQVLMALLENKYGVLQKNRISSQRYAAKRVTLNERYIETSCSGYNVTLNIRYSDAELENSSKNNPKSSVQKLDASGL